MDLRRSAAACLAALACACDPGMLVGSDLTGSAVDATTNDGAPDDATDGGPPNNTGAEGGATLGDGSPIFFATSFEDGFNDFMGGADCYSGIIPNTDGIYNPVGPIPAIPGLPSTFGYVHSGSYSAAFSINTVNETGYARCFLNNGLPETAYYSAWFYIYGTVTNSTGWNLLHWQRPLGDGGAEYLWDVSLVNEVNGTISPVVIDYVRGTRSDGMQNVATNAWFHLEAYLQRSDTDAGAFMMYLNDVLLVQLPGVSTDTTSQFGFHVGNYAQSLTPSNLVLYVDDVVVATEYVQNDGGLTP